MIHAEYWRVSTCSVAAIAVSYSGAMDWLRALLVLLSIAYTTIKLWRAIQNKRDSE